MAHKSINPLELVIRPHHLFLRQTLLLTSGDFLAKDFNCMTIGWGAMGTMWNKPFVLVAVRPTRYTYRFMNKYPDFTVTAFSSAYDADLEHLGGFSGRNGNKLASCQITPIAATRVAAPTFAQAELSLECRKIYMHDFTPELFLDPDLENRYSNRDYHRVFYGEIIAANGTPEFSFS